MKVTVKSKQKEDMSVPFDKIPVGYVYIAGRYNGPLALKLENNGATLLTYNSDGSNNWFDMADGYKDVPAYKILGRLTEIIVEEE